MEILRYAAFTGDPAGGNPAGVVLDADRSDDAEDAAPLPPNAAIRRPRS